MITFIVVICASTYGKKMTKLIPFIIGILAGYAVAMIFTIIGYAAGIDAIKVIDFAPFKALVDGGVGLKTFLTVPKFTFMEALKGVTLESIAIAGRTVEAAKSLESLGVIKADDLPLLYHIGRLLDNETGIDVPWKKFEKEVY